MLEESGRGGFRSNSRSSKTPMMRQSIKSPPPIDLVPISETIEPVTTVNYEEVKVAAPMRDSSNNREDPCTLEVISANRPSQPSKLHSNSNHTLISADGVKVSFVTAKQTENEIREY